MSTSTFQQPHIVKSAPVASAPISGGTKEQVVRKPSQKDRESALREADRIIEKLEESYWRTSTVLRNCSNFGSKS